VWTEITAARIGLAARSTTETIGESRDHTMKTIRQFFTGEEGADLIEYALLAGLISLAAVTALGTVGTSITGLFGKISTKLDGVTVP
jgi:pilus assembly protein Flp/PilA